MSHDAVIVGSGINSLVAGALLSRAGWSVCILERNDVLGGAIRTAEITKPGFRHEVFSSWHPLFVSSAGYAELREELERRGVEYLNTELATASAFPDGSSAFLTTSEEANVAEFARHAPSDGSAWEQTVASFLANADLTFGALSAELWSREGVGLGIKLSRRLGRSGMASYLGEALATCRDWATETFESKQAHGLLAPWVLHTGLGPDAVMSGFMTRVIAVAIQLIGMPVPKGGGSQLVEALAGIVTDAGGSCLTGRHVTRVVVSQGRATAVETSDGERIEASRAVLANVTPPQLYGDLLGGTPSEAAREAMRFRFGRAGAQIHMALSEPPRWSGDERLNRTALVHVTSGLNGVSRAVNEAERGLIPAEPTIVCGQPCTIDPGRAPEGSSILWIQLQELPQGRVLGDAAGELEIGDGTWTAELRERYADRVQEQLGRHIQNLDRALIQRVTFSPVDLEASNPKFGGGDIYSGSCTLGQNLLWRPRPGLPGHRTPIERLYLIGASTHPGPGLGAGSGYLVARELTKPSVPRRAIHTIARRPKAMK